VANECPDLWQLIAVAIRNAREETTPFCARMYPGNPDHTEADEEPVVAIFQVIAQLWRELLGRQQGPEQNVRVEQQLHALQHSSSSWGRGSKNASSTRPCRPPLPAALPQTSGPGRSYGDPARQALRALVHDGVSPQRLAVKQELGTRLLESAGPPSPVPIQARHQRFDTRELDDYEN